MFISEDEDIMIAKVAPSRPEGDIAESFDALCIIVSRVYTEPFGETRQISGQEKLALSNEIVDAIAEVAEGDMRNILPWFCEGLPVHRLSADQPRRGRSA